MRTVNVSDLCQAARIHFWLDDAGIEIERWEFVENMALDPDLYYGYVVYLGPGFVPLAVAIQTFGTPSESDAYDALEDWCRRTDRMGEIGEGPEVDEDEWGNYESSIARVEISDAVITLQMDKMGKLHAFEGALEPIPAEKYTYINPLNEGDPDWFVVEEGDVNAILEALPDSQVSNLNGGWNSVTDLEIVRDYLGTKRCDMPT